MISFFIFWAASSFVLGPLVGKFLARNSVLIDRCK